jgi:hypothetical protein
MEVSNHTKQERRTAVLQAIQTLKEAFPLQRNLENAGAPLQQAYREILSYWIRHGMPPARNWAPEPLLKTLCEFDALLIDEHGISCYPFSARDAGIQVEYAGRSVHAICAMDALAIPRLVEQEARVTARCKICRRDIACSVAANGSVDGGYSEACASSGRLQKQQGLAVISCVTTLPSFAPTA